MYRRKSGDLYYCCPLCSDKRIADSISENCSPDILPSCIHSDVCSLLWGKEVNMDKDMSMDKESSIIEIIKQEPIYMAVVHPPLQNESKSGLVVITTKTLKPKCLTCSSRGKHICSHLKIYKDKVKERMDKVLESSEESSDDSSDEIQLISGAGISKNLQYDRIRLKKDETKEQNSLLDPYSHNGPKSNVFDITINFVPTYEEELKNRTISETNQFFEDNILIPEYLGPTDKCKIHGNEFDQGRNITWIESRNIEIEHTRKVKAENMIILYRPTKGLLCDCKKFYTGKREHLLRVTSASEIQCQKSRRKKIHFVSYELLYKFLGQLLTGGDKLDSFVKANNFMSEIFFGLEKRTVSPKILQKAFEIFIHALIFPEKSNFCWECPQKLEDGENEDDYKDIEVSVVDGIQMGCQTNDAKGNLPREYFDEETDGDELVKGVEAKDRTFLKSKKIRDVIALLIKHVDNKNQLKDTIKRLEKIQTEEKKKDEMTGSILVLLKRLYGENRILPQGYRKLFAELSLITPISALLTAYTSKK